MKYKSFITFSCLVVIALASVVCAPAAEKVTLVAGGKPVFLHTSPMLVDGTVYVPLTALSVVGAKSEDPERKRDGQKVRITSAAGEEFSHPAKLIRGELMLPILQIASRLGTRASWNASSKTMILQAEIERIEFDGNELRVELSHPATFETTWWASTNRLILDIDGVYIPSKQSDLNIHNSSDIVLRTGARDTGGRIVLDMPGSVQHRVRSARRTSRIVVSVSGVESRSQPAVSPRPSDTAETSTSLAHRPIVEITDISHVRQGARNLEVHISTSGTVNYVTSMRRDPDQLILDFSDAWWVRETDAIHVGHGILQGILIDQHSERAVRVILDLARVVSFDVQQDRSPSRLVVSLELPRGAGGLLSQRTIVVDPGHGGSDPGAAGLGGLREKDSNLAIALQLQQALLDEGAAVLMTRRTDIRLDDNRSRDLAKRTEFARRHSADIFISIHSNAVSGPRSPSGIMTFYHGRDASSSTLARVIQAEMVKASGLPCMGHRSDFTLYNTGLAVLRGTTGNTGMPAVLLEIGFVRHPTDAAKLKDPKFHRDIAQAIVRGLKSYVEGNPRPAVRRETVDPPASRGTERPAERQEQEPVRELHFDLTPQVQPEHHTEVSRGPARPGDRR